MFDFTECFCPACGKEHTVLVNKERTNVTINGLNGTYMKYYCLCEITGRKFIPGWMAEKNQHRAKMSLQTSYKF